MARQILGKVVPTGEDTYDNSRTYNELCIVMYNGQSYISKKETRGNKPDNTEYWQQLVEKPVKGADYFTEADKDEIVNDVTNDATNKYNQAVATGIETFNQNAERKTSDFNDNASEKTDTYNANVDSATQAFTDNANSKTEAYNTNATEKLNTYNSNHIAKLKEYNDNASSKLSAYNTNTVAKTTEYNSNHTSKINAYNSNASSKVDIYDANADKRLEEYNDNTDNKIAEYDEHSKELNNKIVSIGNDYRMVKDQLLYTGEDTDTFIHVEDSAMAEMKEIKVDGVCEQNTTTGKNLFDENNSTHNLVLENGDITANAAWNMSNYIEVSGNTDYVVKRNDTTSTSQSFILIEFDADKKIIKRNVQGVRNTNIPYTITTTDTTRYLIFNYNNTYNNTMLQLEKGSTPTDYEPYTGGQPSPSPDYPQEIKTITDSLKVTSCGKNVFNFNNILDNMAWNENGLVANSLTIAINKHQDIHSSAITFSVDFNQNSGTQGRLLVYDKNKTLISNNIIATFPFTKVFESNAKYYTYYFLKEQIPMNSKIQLEPSNTASEYEPYVESLITANLPEGEFIGKLDDTYKDTLRTQYFPEEGQYHLMLDKIIGHKNFNDASSILYFELQGDYFLFQISMDYMPTTKMISNNFVNKTNFGTQYSYESIYRGAYGNNAFQFKIKKERVTSYDNNGALSFIKNSNTDVYYALKAPKTIDLGVIDMPMSYKDITNIFTDSNLLPSITAKYYRVFDKTIQNAQINDKTLKQEITDLNATVSALDTRLKALEAKTVEEPTESEGTV